MNHMNRSRRDQFLPLTPVLPAGGRTGQHEVGTPRTRRQPRGLWVGISRDQHYPVGDAQAEVPPAGILDRGM
ncbi:Uncharacterised protein [Mycobacterium tuberculosis]|nr:Uncharacterised protein [Mycobacterium tuberculosis]CKR61646.1 Uncharacterised protein [Mycobacterium tuberculosis]CKS29164.1 Uncharacterised protein [Mycobacterium tuberculosis]COX61248.1 Uncharacterised protein [Mycobacterium tuberculosis]